MTYYGGKTLDGWNVEGMIDDQRDYVNFIKDTKFFVRGTFIETFKDEPLKSAFALFLDADDMRRTPILAMLDDDPENESDKYVDEQVSALYSYAKTVGIADMEEDKLKKLIELTEKLEGVQYKECEACDSEGHIVEGVIDFEGKEVFVHSCFENPLTFEAECALSIIENEGGNK